MRDFLGSKRGQLAVCGASAAVDLGFGAYFLAAGAPVFALAAIPMLAAATLVAGVVLITPDRR
ncbi:hypothetical protein [Gryllotalpicola protaetiae]|uniref:Uncharacterized protein n=1 Tax=Gryllotalpicola protaetiae TaxID=2419771 RepID=A0A387BN24_9MICO|nr:hypothetical protein [Gryllotalpicola protaetiae]AYG03424.1 hypothetical protein D7I44_07665 [Gryllotalpicola protaetiae]